MKPLILTLLATCFASPAFANVYVKTVDGKIVEVAEAELQKANHSAGLECQAVTPSPSPSPAPSNICQPVYQERRGYAVFAGEVQMSDFSSSYRDVIATYQKLQLRGTCQAGVQHDCDLTLNGYNNNYATINGRMASSWGDDRSAIEVFNAYRDANICK
ncbi:MAG: hypothetical protein ACXWQO_00005 [Bdellovibrionota bacterium]